MGENNQQTQPLLKWPGGKRRVLPEIQKYVPEEYTTYQEPFLGGGAVFFNLQPTNAHINDLNTDLINFYQQTKTNPHGLITELKNPQYENTLETFLRIRALDRDEDQYNTLTNTQKAARFLYLNRTCFNGLYRVNNKNQFNAHYGKYTNPKIIDEENILKVSNLFNQNNTTITNTSYQETLETETTNHFIYLDPPYIPTTITASFARYTPGQFHLQQHEELATIAQQKNDEGNYILLSNSNTPQTLELYKNFHIIPIEVKRSIGASAATRINAKEVLIIGKKLAEHLKLK